MEKGGEVEVYQEGKSAARSHYGGGNPRDLLNR